MHQCLESVLKPWGSASAGWDAAVGSAAAAVVHDLVNGGSMVRETPLGGRELVLDVGYGGDGRHVVVDAEEVVDILLDHVLNHGADGRSVGVGA